MLQITFKEWSLSKSFANSVKEVRRAKTFSNNYIWWTWIPLFKGRYYIIHRVNLRGITYINRFLYDEATKNNISMETDNIASHVIGIDFNLLYLSVSSSTKHLFNLYHRIIKFMPWSLTNAFNCYDQNVKLNENNKQ